MANNNSQFPPEIVDKIIELLWTSNDLSSSDRILFMTTCPLFNHSWKAQFSRIATRYIYVPRLSYLLYLASIAWGGKLFKSFIYTQLDLRNRVQTMTCNVDLRSNRDKKTEDVYWILSNLWTGYYGGLKRCFPSLKELRLEAAVYTPIHLWTSELPQVAYTQIILNLDEQVSVEQDAGARLKAIGFRLYLNIAIHDPDVYLGVTDALWKYCDSPLSGYLELLVRIAMGGLMNPLRLCDSEDTRGEFAKARDIGQRLRDSRRLQDLVHLFSTSALFVSFINPFYPRFCHKRYFEDEERSLHLSHSVCTPLCWFRPQGQTVAVGELAYDSHGWDRIVPELQKDSDTLRWCGYALYLLVGVDLEGPCQFRAVEDLHRIVESEKHPRPVLMLFG
ncbi:hypothetical protein VKT23_010534 [Stygiomarasmius scandens]|uniref:F-box domain-containing protein n=1 Tax=Marasmiellus scandens TaxID=2682957 RepID=A0ABR1JCR8_9AGAR